MNINAAIATLFGIGRAPYAPGTVASLVALPLAWIIAAEGGRISLLLAAIFVSALGGWACEHYVRESGRDDPSECVVDELAGQWLALAFAPLGILHGLLAYALAFIVFRAPLTKPWPIPQPSGCPEGWG